MTHNDADRTNRASAMDDTSDMDIDAEHEPELTDEDILDAMRHVPGYLDISTEDFRTIYHLAWKHAIERLRAHRQQQREARSE